jgi:predicted RNase H-like HicB family nuclease
MEMVADATETRSATMSITHAILHEENGVFGVSFPDFPGCVTGGLTEEEAVRKADQVLTFHVAGMLEDGEAIPATRPLRELWKDADFVDSMKTGILFLARYDLPKKSVRINVSMDEVLVEAIDRAAELTNQSRSAFLSDAARMRITQLAA